MSRYPDTVDVVIVGSGPTGAAYARILSEEAPGATVALFEVGPTVSDPPGAHVKNIQDAAVPEALIEQKLDLHPDVVSAGSLVTTQKAKVKSILESRLREPKSDPSYAEAVAKLDVPSNGS